MGYKSLGLNTYFMAIAAKKHKIDIDRANEKLKYLADVELFPLDTDVKLIPAFLHLFRKKSYNISRFYSKSFAKKISEKLSANNFDAVQFETIFMAPYLSIVKEKTSAPCILRQHNMESEIWERRANREVNPLKKWYVKHLTKRLRDYEKKMLPKFDSIVWVTEHDLQKGKNESGHTPNFVVPSGVEIPIETSELKTNKNKWYHLGALDWPPNLEALMWFLKSVWPKMIEENRELELHIAGRNCPNFLKKYKAKGVYVYGEIPNKETFLVDKSVCLVPIKSGSGIRIKLLEAIANKKIVVSTEIGSQGIPKKLLKSTILANSAEGFISAAKRVHDIDAKIIDEMKSNLIAEYSIQNTSLQMAKILFPSSDSSFLNKN